jgi:hypothetical protein
MPPHAITTPAISRKKLTGALDRKKIHKNRPGVLNCEK